MKVEKTIEVETEMTKETEAEISENVKREVKEEDIVDMALTRSGAANPEVAPELEMLESVMSNYCFSRNTSFNDLLEQLRS